MQTAPPPLPAARFERRPTWEMLDLLPRQGDWSVEEYLRLDTNRFVEFTDGFLEFLPMPDEVHQQVNLWLILIVLNFLDARGRGVLMQPPFKVQVGPRLFREPDLCVLLDEGDPRRRPDHWTGADLVFEIVSPDRPARDYVEKRQDYAAAGIPEYWVIDPRPEQRRILRLSLRDGRYDEATFAAGDIAPSLVAPNLALDVSVCLAAADRAAARGRSQL